MGELMVASVQGTVSEAQEWRGRLQQLCEGCGRPSKFIVIIIESIFYQARQAGSGNESQATANQ